MEHFKLVFGSGKSDPAKIRPLKVWAPAITAVPGSHHPPAWVFAAAKLFLVGISNKVLNKLKKKTKEG